MQDRLSIDHFDAIARRYAASTATLKPLYDAVREELNGRLAGKAILDVGNGGIFPYDRARAASVAVLDISPEMLKRAPAGVRTILADARDMRECEDESFDAVLFNLSLHHIAAGSREATSLGLRRALAEGWRTLRPGGELIVYEPLLNPFLHRLQSILFRPLRALLSLLGVPMVFIQSPASLRALLAGACGIEAGAVAAVFPPVSGWSDPLGGTFPGLLLIPASLHPTRFALFRAVKPGG